MRRAVLPPPAEPLGLGSAAAVQLDVPEGYTCRSTLLPPPPDGFDDEPLTEPPVAIRSGFHRSFGVDVLSNPFPLFEPARDDRSGIAPRVEETWVDDADVVPLDDGPDDSGARPDAPERAALEHRTG